MVGGSTVGRSRQNVCLLPLQNPQAAKGTVFAQYFARFSAQPVAMQFHSLLSVKLQVTAAGDPTHPLLFCRALHSSSPPLLPTRAELLPAATKNSRELNDDGDDDDAAEGLSDWLDGGGGRGVGSWRPFGLTKP